MVQPILFPLYISQKVESKSILSHCVIPFGFAYMLSRYSCKVVLLFWKRKKGFVYVTQMKDGFWCTVGIRGHPFFGLESDLTYSVCKTVIH